MIIPVCTIDGDILYRVSRDILLENRDASRHLNFKRNKKGKVTAAYLKPVLSLDSRPNSMVGLAFEQHFPNGVVWALAGVEGSR